MTDADELPTFISIALRARDRLEITATVDLEMLLQLRAMLDTQTAIMREATQPARPNGTLRLGTKGSQL